MKNTSKKAHNAWTGFDADFYAEKDLLTLFDEVVLHQVELYGDDLSVPCREAQALLDKWTVDGESCLPDWRDAVARFKRSKIKTVENVQMWGDATQIGDVTPEDADDLLTHPIAVLTAPNCKTPGPKWVLLNTTLNTLLTETLLRHPVADEKDGPAIAYGVSVPGSVVDGQKRGFRIQASIEAATAFVVDVDGSDKAARLRDRLAELGYFAVIYTTPSHHEKRTETGDRFRIVVFLKEPFAFPDAVKIKKGEPRPRETEDRRAAIAEWHSRYAGMCELLGLEEIDTSAMNLHHMQFTPRRLSKDAEFEHYVIAGDLLDWRDMPKGDASKYRKGMKAPSGATLSKKNASGSSDLSDDFMLSEWWEDNGNLMSGEILFDLIGWDVRGPASGGWIEILCPNSAAHSDPNDDAAGFIDGEDGFAIHCFHDHCENLRTWQFLVLIEQAILNGEAVLPDGYETLSELLCDPCLYPDEIDGEPVEFDHTRYIRGGCSLTIEAVAELIETNGINKDSSVKEVQKFLGEHLAADAASRKRFVDALGSTSRKDGATVLSPKEIKATWEELDREHANSAFEEEAERRKALPTPDYIPLDEATHESVGKAASAATWLPSGWREEDGWFGFFDFDEKKFKPVCRAFEVVYMADGEKGQTRTNQLTIRYAHRSSTMGVVESIFRIGDTYKDSGTILGNLRNEGLEFYANAKTDQILTLLRAVSSKRQTVYCAQAGWFDDRSAYVAPTGKVVKKSNDDRLYVLDKAMRVSAETRGTVEDYTFAMGVALRGKNALTFAPGALLGAVGCLADFLETEHAVIIANEGGHNTGKTTSLMAGVSFFAIPEIQGLLFSANSTETAFEAMAMKGSGACIAPDDAGTSKRTAEDEQRQIYQFANQMGRGRGTTTGGLQELNTWNGAMGTSTERGLLSRLQAEGADTKSGVQSRVFTVNFDGVERLNKKDDADLLEAYDTLSHGGVYGVAWEPFAEKLLELGADEVRARVNEYELEWGADTVGGERVVTTGALLAVASEICQEAGLWPANDDKLNVQVLLKQALENTLSQRADVLDNARQASESLRLEIIRGIGRGQVVSTAEGKAEGYRDTLGYWTSPDSKSGAGNKDSNEVTEAMRARTYILPIDRLPRLGLKIEVTALIEQLRSEGALILSKDKTFEGKGIWQSTPLEGSHVNSVRVSGEWVHGRP